MAPQFTRLTISGPPAPAHRPTVLARPQCEQLEGRETPTLFTVQPALSFTGLNNNGCVAVGDLNKDGLADAILTNYGTGASLGDGTVITVLYGKAGGGFNRVERSTGGTNVSFVDIADINGDGWLDAVAVNANKQGVGSVTVFRNTATGSGSLSATLPDGSTNSPYSTFLNNSACVRLADVTGDGLLDLVVCGFGREVGSDNIEGNGLAVFAGNADGAGKGNFTFATSPSYKYAQLSFIPTALATADFDGDGKVDIAAVSSGIPPDFGQPYPQGVVTLFRGTGGGAFASPTSVDSAGVLPVNVQAADVSGDGKPDLVIANAGDPQNAQIEFKDTAVGVLVNESGVGDIAFGIPNSLTNNAYGVFAVQVADLNLDGKADLAAVNYGGQLGSPAPFVSVYLGAGGGGFTPASPGTYTVGQSGGIGGQYLAVADFNGDTAPDLIAVGAFDRVSVLANTTVPPRVESVAANRGQTDLAQRSRVTNLAVTFTTTVTISAGAFTLRRVGTYEGDPGDNALVTAAFTAATVNGKTVATLTFSGANTVGGSLADGVWQLTVDRTKVRTTAGNVFMGANWTSPAAGAGRLYRLYGDINGDGQVNSTDYRAFDRTFGSVAGDAEFVAGFDVNNDTQINSSDFRAFDRNFGRTI